MEDESTERRSDALTGRMKEEKEKEEKEDRERERVSPIPAARRS